MLSDVAVVARGNDCLSVDFPEHGGHVGFIGGRWPWRPIHYMESRVFGFLNARMTDPTKSAWIFEAKDN